MHKRIVSFIGVLVVLLIAGMAWAKHQSMVRVSHHDSNDSPLYLSLTEWIDAGGQHTFTNDYEKPFKLTSVGFLVSSGTATDVSITHYRYIGRRYATSNAVVTAWGSVGDPQYYTTTNWVKAFVITNGIVTNVLYTGTHAASGSDLSVILSDEDDLPDNWWILGNDQVEFAWTNIVDDYFIANFEK